MPVQQRYNLPLVVMIIVVIFVLFISMIFNSISAADVNDSSCSSEERARNAHKWATWSAVINGLGVAVLVIVVAIYLWAKGSDILSEVTAYRKGTGGVVGAHNALLIVLLVAGIILLFISMILSAMAADDISNTKCSLENKARTSQKWATIAAVMNGFGAILLVIALAFYIYTNRQEYQDTAAEEAKKLWRGVGGWPDFSPDTPTPLSEKVVNVPKEKVVPGEKIPSFIDQSDLPSVSQMLAVKAAQAASPLPPSAAQILAIKAAQTASSPSKQSKATKTRTSPVKQAKSTKTDALPFVSPAHKKMPSNLDLSNLLS